MKKVACLLVLIFAVAGQALCADEEVMYEGTVKVAKDGKRTITLSFRCHDLTWQAIRKIAGIVQYRQSVEKIKKLAGVRVSVAKGKDPDGDQAVSLWVEAFFKPLIQDATTKYWLQQAIRQRTTFDDMLSILNKPKPKKPSRKPKSKEPEKKEPKKVK